VWLVALASGVAGRADEAAILADMRAFFATEDTARRVEIAGRIERDPAYDRAQVREWLHRAGLFTPLRPGRLDIQVPLHAGGTRTVVLRIPKDYDPAQPWPLIYALHGMNGRAADIIGYVQRLLGDEVEDYVIAAPDRYADTAIHQNEWPPTGEHPAALLRIRQTVHVDSDRVFVLGYSMGGHTSWTLAMLYADQFAGAIPLAGSFTMIVPDKLWETFLPNVASLPVLCVWGAADTQDNRRRESPDGGIAGMNRRLRALTGRLQLPITMIELPDKGHRGVLPPADELATILAQTRAAYPRQVRHSFRHLCQGSAYWLEAHQWTGEQWTDKKRTIVLREGDPAALDLDEAAARLYRSLLAELRGEIDGQEIRVHRKKISELIVWIGDGMIDWDQPVVLDTGDKEPFEVKLRPDLYICLSQAARTWDFDRLRWAGIRVRPSAGRPHLVTPKTTFPPVFERAKTRK
jgi:pimeloyl-ACP methyl ester carboxylesterase